MLISRFLEVAAIADQIFKIFKNFTETLGRKIKPYKLLRR